MLNTIIAYIVAVALSLGAAAVPAIPETVNQAAIENVVIRVGDESFALDSRAVFSAAAGTQESALGFCLENNGNKFFPVNAKITPENAVFSISESGSAFRIADEALMEMIGLTAEDLPEVYRGDELQQMYGGMGSLSLEENMAYREAVLEFFCSYEGAEVTEGSFAYEGGEYPCTTVYIEEGLPAVWALLDHLRLGDYGQLSVYLENLLVYYSEEMDKQGESYAGMFGEINDFPPIAVEYSRAEVDGEPLHAVRITAEEYYTIDMVSTVCSNVERVEMTMEIEEGNYTIIFEAKIEMLNRMIEGEKRIDAGFSLTQETEYITDEMLREVMDIDFSLDENGNETACAATLAYGSWMIYPDYTDVTSSDSAEFDALLTKTENGVHVNANLKADFYETRLDAGVDFDVNLSEAAYADPFEGKSTVDFSTPEDLTESGQFIAEGASLAMDAMRITLTQDAVKLAQIAVLLSEPKEVSDEDYAAASEVFGARLPEFKLPDGWIMKDADVVEGMAKLYFVSEDEEEFQVFAFCHDGTGERVVYMQLGEDGKLIPASGGMDFSGANGGGWYSATAVHGNVMLDFWFYDADEEFVRTVVSNIVWAE